MSKFLIALFAVVGLSLNTYAEQQLMKDKGSADLAKLLAGKAIYCGPSGKKDANTEDAGFFPVKITATDKGGGKTLLKAETKNPKVGFCYGGDEFDDTEMSTSWTVIACGDDGRRYLFLGTYGQKDLPTCYRSTDAEVEGDIPGVLSEIEDSVTIFTRGVQCCVK